MWCIVVFCVHRSSDLRTCSIRRRRSVRSLESDYTVCGQAEGRAERSHPANIWNWCCVACRRSRPYPPHSTLDRTQGVRTLWWSKCGAFETRSKRALPRSRYFSALIRSDGCDAVMTAFGRYVGSGFDPHQIRGIYGQHGMWPHVRTDDQDPAAHVVWVSTLFE